MGSRRTSQGLGLYPEALSRCSRGRAFGARAFPGPFGLGARLGGRSRGPYTSDHKSRSGSPLVLGALILSLLVSQGTWSQAVGQDPSGQPEASATLETVFPILIVDVAEVRASASAYSSIQRETERARDVINAAYETRLARLQAVRNDLLGQEGSLSPEAFQTQTSALERQAIDLENSRRRNFALIESRRQQASGVVDAQLNAVLTDLLLEAGATYMLNQQSALIWPDAVNVTAAAIDQLNQRVPAISFQIDISDVTDPDAVP